MTDQTTLAFVETMQAKTTKPKTARSRQNAPPAPEDVAKYTQRFSAIDHAWFSGIAAREKRSLNSWIYAAAMKAAGFSDPNYRLSPTRKPKNP
jgi:predicted HicB family RNase H-like nuclease